MHLRILIIGLATVILFQLVWSGEKYRYNKMYKATCTKGDKYVYNISCKAKSLSRNNTVLDLIAYGNQNFSDVMLAFELFRKYQYFRPFLIKGAFNFCKYLLNKSGVNKGFIPFIDRVLQYTNIQHPCPYDRLIINQLELDFDLIPASVPTGQYMINFTLYIKRPSEFLGQVLTYFDVIEKSTHK